MSLIFYVVAFILGYLTARQVHALAIQRIQKVWEEVQELGEELHTEYVMKQIAELKKDIDKVIKK